jgi:hypothetical protein
MNLSIVEPNKGHRYISDKYTSHGVRERLHDEAYK